MENFELDNYVKEEELTEYDLIMMLKRLLNPRGYVTPDELKKLICDWIDLNITNMV